MSTRRPFVQLARWSPIVRDWLGRFGRWWLSELMALFPPRIAGWLIGHGRRRLALAPQSDQIVLTLMDDDRQPLAVSSVNIAEYSAAAVDDFLKSHKLTRQDAALGIRFPADQLFGRRLILPVEAVRAMDQVLVQDLARKTPFRPQDICCDQTTEKSAGSDKIVVWQWVARRQSVEEAADLLEIGRDDVAFVDAESSTDGKGPLPYIRLHQRRSGGVSWLRIATSGLVACALLLASAAGGLTYWRQQSMLDQLEIELAAAKSKAQRVRSAIDGLEVKQKTLVRLRVRKSETPGLLDILDETTRLLPTHSWLTELQVSETQNQQRQIVMTGLSTDAPSLVGLFDRSPLFADASLTAPVSLDPVQGRERFTLQARVPGATGKAPK